MKSLKCFQEHVFVGPSMQVIRKAYPGTQRSRKVHGRSAEGPRKPEMQDWIHTHILCFWMNLLTLPSPLPATAPVPLRSLGLHCARARASDRESKAESTATQVFQERLYFEPSNADLTACLKSGNHIESHMFLL